MSANTGPTRHGRSSRGSRSSPGRRRGIAARVGVASACAAGALAAGVIVFTLFWPASVPSFTAVRAAYVPSDAWLLDRHGVVIASKRIRYDARRLAWVPLFDVSPALVRAIIEGEDRHFWHHRGVDWRSVAGAARDELIHRHRRGASTITMQMATLLRGRRGGGDWGQWLEKLEQVRMALSLERSWTKPEILEAYLNLLGYKGELQGIGATTAELAGKTPSGLSVPESLVLAALLPDPSAAPQRVIARACARGRGLHPTVDCAAVRVAAHEILASHAAMASDALAPQLASELLRRPGERLSTSLDAGIQRTTLEIVRSHISALSNHNVRDAAALVVDNATGEVLAYVSSAAPDSRAAEVDGVRAPRQAGSTLKPFLYELALERRYITAASLLADSPLSLDTASGVYIPQDYDHDFKGLVSARTALASSLNVPAVRTLVLTGVEAFRDRLNELGYSGITRDGSYYFQLVSQRPTEGLR